MVVRQIVDELPRSLSNSDSLWLGLLLNFCALIETGHSVHLTD